MGQVKHAINKYLLGNITGDIIFHHQDHFWCNICFLEPHSCPKLILYFFKKNKTNQGK